MEAFAPIDWYDVPRYYDIVFDEDTILEADFLERMAMQFGTSGGRHVLEPACGSGRLMEAMARRGWAAAGFDRNDRMVQYTIKRMTRRGLRAHVFTGDLSDFRPGRGRRFDLAHCLVSTFKYLLTEDEARRHLECVAQALRPGGVYVLGLHLTDYATVGRTRERWVARRGRTRVTSNLQIWPADRRRRVERVRARLRVEDPGRVRRLETHWYFRTYDARQLRRLLASVPALRCVASYDFTYDAPRPFDDEQLDLVLVFRRR